MRAALDDALAGDAEHAVFDGGEVFLGDVYGAEDLGLDVKESDGAVVALDGVEQVSRVARAAAGDGRAVGGELQRGKEVVALTHGGLERVAGEPRGVLEFLLVFSRSERAARLGKLDAGRLAEAEELAVGGELVNAEAKAQVSPTPGYVSAGQLIISEGEIVTAEVEQMLNSYKKEYEANLGYSGSKFVSN